MWAADLVTVPFVLTPIAGERRVVIFADMLRHGGVAETAQYVVGLIGALLVLHGAWALLLLPVMLALIYLAFRPGMDETTFELLRNTADSIDAHLDHTAGHSARVAELAKGILNQMSMRGQEAQYVVTASRIHDIGRMGLPDEIFMISGPLSAEERAAIETHASRAAHILSGYPDFIRGVPMILHHHERWDGAGYPDGLAGTDIPFGARVIAVAEAYDALTSDRPYRPRLSSAEAAAVLRAGRGVQWDPMVVDALLRSAASIPPYGPGRPTLSPESIATRRPA
jgi:HD-GYP domain-containing protein (c-di-GMP phosphodiesterase class II)